MAATIVKLAEEERLFTHCKLSAESKRNYAFALKGFEKYSGIKGSDIVDVDPKDLKKKLIGYVIHLKESGLSYSKQEMVMSAVQKVYELNEMDGISWAVVRNYMSDNDNSNGGRDQPYTKEELQKLLANANIRTKAVVLFMLSSGVRIGAVPSLKLKDLQKMDKYGIYRIEVYADSKRDRYFSFLTPEATAALDAYLQSRTIKGEKLGPHSPVFRLEFDSENANTDVKPLTKSGVFRLVTELAVNAGLRKVARKTPSGYAPRHAAPLTHSLRKLCHTALVKSGCKGIVCELILGHSIGIQAHYLRLTPDEMAQEYIKAIDLLTVSSEKQLQEQVNELQTQVSDLDAMKRAYLELKAEKEQDEGYIAHLQEEWELERQRQQEQVRQLAEAIRESQQAVAELRDTVERKLLQRESKRRRMMFK